MAARLRKYYKTASLAALGPVADHPLFALELVLRFLRVAVLLALWRMVMEGRETAAGLSTGQLLTYTLIAEVFREQLSPRTELRIALWEGTLAVRLLQPLSLVEQLGADMVGRWSVGLTGFSLPLLLAAPLLGVDPRPASLAALGLFFLSLALTLVVGLALDFLFGALMIASENSIWAVAQLQAALTLLLSGQVLPLAVLPWGLGGVFEWLPFAATASAPLRIYTGAGDPVRLLLLQIAWALVLWPLVGWLWRRWREKLVSQGG